MLPPEFLPSYSVAKIREMNLGFNPYEQQPGESAKAYAAFQAYLGMGPQRSTREVGRKLSKSGALIFRWSSRWRWGERVRAWDRDQAAKIKAAEDAALAQKAQEWLKRQDEIREREYRLAESLFAKVAQMLRKPLSKVQWTLLDAAKMAMIATDLAHRACGLPTLREQEKQFVQPPQETRGASGRIIIYDPKNPQFDRAGPDE
jgi:hypothetical protein